MRDNRIDLIRGVAVLAIATNHINSDSPNMVNVPHYEFGQIFSFNFADVFIFFSGIVCGIVYFKVFSDFGFRAVFSKSLIRVKQIWLAQILCTLLTFFIIFIFKEALSTESATHGISERSILEAFVGSILLYNPARFLDILPLYIFFITALPFALVLIKKAPLILITLSGGLWLFIWLGALLTQIGITSFTPIPPKSNYFMHPLSAQFLFFLGVALGTFHNRVLDSLQSGWKYFLPACIAFLIFSDYLRQVNFMHFYFDQKSSVGPLRIADLASVSAIIFMLVPNTAALGNNSIARCGRYSLEVFTFSVALAYFFTLSNNLLEGGRIIYAASVFCAAMLCMLFGGVTESYRKARMLLTNNGARR